MKDVPRRSAKDKNHQLKQGCPVCGDFEMIVFFEVEDAPVFCNRLWKTRAEALAAPLGPIRLAYCHNCGLIYNVAFDNTLMQYSSNYENSLHFSQHFRQWAEETAGRLVKSYQLYGKDVIEIGCGQGDFLALLKLLGGNRVMGFDPSYDSEKSAGLSEDQNVMIIPETYSENHKGYPADFICCRHVLEHIEDPLNFLRSIRRAIGKRQECVVYFEVPNALHCLQGMGLWDIIYEHCSYFTSESLANLFLRAGFEPIEIGEHYDRQFLTIEARPWYGSDNRTIEPEWKVQNISDLIESVYDLYRETLLYWQQTLSTSENRNRRIVIWGAGSKGVTFVNELKISHRQIEYIVDVNPRKKGSFVPGTGQCVIEPDLLREYDPGTIIIMNPVYSGEIEDISRKLGLNTQFLLSSDNC